MRRGFAFLFLALSAWGAAQEFTLTVLHTNDLHARAEPAMIRRKPYGGYARQATLIHQYRKSDPNPILLNGGDTFQGTLYFNVYEGLAEAAFMNQIGYQAMAVGNHEFDRGPGPLGTFAKNAKFPLLAANLDVSAEPALNGLIKASSIVEVGGQRIGIVGAVTPDTPSISSPGPNVRFLEIYASVQKAVDELHAQGVNKVILVSHCGYGLERQLAAKIKGLDAIVGGHSHSYLGPSLADLVQGNGPYPTVVENPSGGKCLVLQAWEWGKVLGRIKITFDAAGQVLNWSDASPILVDESIPEDPDIASLIAALRKPIEALQTQEIGTTDTGLPRGGNDSPMANVITDAMLEATKSQGSVAAFMNAGGVRSALEPGKITYGAAITVQPFSNTLTILELTGAELKEALEHGAEVGGGLLYPSQGTSYRIDRSKPRGNRISEVVVSGHPLEPAKTYRLTFNSFTSSGGDAHEVLKAAKGTRTDTGFLDIDALVAYIKANTPVNRKPEARIKS
jgi:5'-nucleotidase / UDP-sugar diphosphatase